MRFLWLAPFLLLLAISPRAIGQSSPQPLPNGTAIPIAFTRTIDAGKARPGDPVLAKTMQIVLYGPTESIPKGSKVIGHVVEAKAFVDQDEPSTIEIQFDKIEYKQQTTPFRASVRALANVMDVAAATRPTDASDMDPSRAFTLVGGDQEMPGEKQVYSADGDDVGINNRFGIFSRLEPGESINRLGRITCAGIPTLQSVAIFSSTACGLYGFPDTFLRLTGNESNNGTIELESNRYTIEVHSGSAALLQVVR
ncbi:MAG: hypothetical protein ACYDC6_06515 [Acidobacteriaceae bacterium]